MCDALLALAAGERRRLYKRFQCEVADAYWVSVLLVEKDASVYGTRKMQRKVRTKYAAMLPDSS